MFEIIFIGVSFFGLIAGFGLYFHKNWSQLLVIFIVTFYLVYSLSGLMILASSGKIISYIMTELIIYGLFATWCLYFINRIDVDEKLKIVKPDNENDGIKIEDKTTKRPRGIKITAILLIIFCGFQIISFILAIPKIAIYPSAVPAIIFYSFLYLILSLLGFVSGFGLLGIRNWARKIVVIFSMVTIAGILFLTAISNEGFMVFICIFSSLLPVWLLYYFTRPHIKVLFALK